MHSTAFDEFRHVPALQSGRERKGADEYIGQIRRLAKTSGVYALSSLAAPLVTLVLAPFLVRHLSHAEYGVLAVMTTAIALLAGITQLGLGSAFFRSYNYDYEEGDERRQIITTTLLLLFLSMCLPLLIVLLSAPWVAVLLFKESSLQDVVKAGCLVVFLQNLTVPGFAWLRAENKALYFSLVSIANVVVMLVATIAYVGWMGLHVAGALLAVASGYLLVLICILPALLPQVVFRVHWRIARELLAFGLPNVCNFISVWVLQLSDRYLLAALGSLAQTASYALAYNLGGVMGVVVLAPFTLAWPSAMFTIAKRDDAALVFRKVFRYFASTLLLAAFGLSVASTIALQLFFPLPYQEAAPIIPVIALSILFFGLYSMFMTGVSIRKKTWYAVLLTSMAAVVNVLLNLWLIPLYGAYGAALATLCAYLLLAICGYLINQRIYPIPYEIGRFLLALLIGVGCYSACGILAPLLGQVVLWGIYCIAFLCYAAVLVMLVKSR